MQWKRTAAAVGAAAVFAMSGTPQAQAPQGRGGGGGGAAAWRRRSSRSIDTNKDGARHPRRDEGARSTSGSPSGTREEQRADAGAAASAASTRGAAGAAPARPGRRPRRGSRRTRRPSRATSQAMMAALPATAPAKPKQPRKVLVLAQGRPASCTRRFRSPARTIEEIGKKTGAWSTTITYDAADINEANLKQYDAIFLASTTGAFLDDPNDAAATAARRKALLDFVRGGKGLAGIHAASDSYHQNRPADGRRAAAGGWTAARRWRRPRRSPAPVVDAVRRAGRQERRSEAERARSSPALADAWFDKFDTDKTGRVAQADFPQRFAAVCRRRHAGAARPRPASRCRRRRRSSVPTRRSAPGPSSTR